MLLCNTGEDPDREDKQILTLVGKQVDGLILGSAHPPGSTRIYEEISMIDIPCVLIDRYFEKLHFVGGDDVMIGYAATEHLITQGYKRVAHVRGPNVSTALGRLKGYRNALRVHGITVPAEYVVEAPFHEESGGAQALETLLRLSSPPDAVFAASDPIAIGVLECALRHGLQVPDDLGVVGVGNHRYGQYLRVPLTTVDQNRVEIRRLAASLLISLINGKPASRPQVRLFKPHLIVRESSLRSVNSARSRQPVLIEPQGTVSMQLQRGKPDRRAKGHGRKRPLRHIVR